MRAESVLGVPPEVGDQLFGLVAELPEAVFTLDRGWRITYLNPAAERMLGWAGNPLGQTVWEQYPEVVGTVLDEALRQALASDEAVSLSGRHPPFSSRVEVRAFPSPHGLAIHVRNLMESISMERLGGATGGEPEFTILYIEDDAASLRLVERLVERRPGMALLTAPHGRQGLELAVGRSPDLILLDLNLPDLSGEQILLQLRRNSRTADIPVLLLSADPSEMQRRMLLELGARGYLTKPLDARLLFQAIGQVRAS